MDENTTVTKELIDTVLRQYQDALEAERQAKAKAADWRSAVALSEAIAYIQADGRGEIDGKNTEKRAQQAIVALSKDEEVQRDRLTWGDAEGEALAAEGVRRIIETRLSMYKAFLYSQAPRT